MPKNTATANDRSGRCIAKVNEMKPQRERGFRRADRQKANWQTLQKPIKKRSGVACTVRACADAAASLSASVCIKDSRKKSKQTATSNQTNRSENGGTSLVAAKRPRATEPAQPLLYHPDRSTNQRREKARRADPTAETGTDLGSGEVGDELNPPLPPPPPAHPAPTFSLAPPPQPSPLASILLAWLAATHRDDKSLRALLRRGFAAALRLLLLPSTPIGLPSTPGLGDAERGGRE